MNAIVVMLLGLGAMFLGYVFYSKFIAEKIYKLDPNFKTPAHEFEDGVDFVPTNKYVLWGHHFTSVAGAAPSLSGDCRYLGLGRHFYGLFSVRFLRWCA